MSVMVKGLKGLRVEEGVQCVDLTRLGHRLERPAAGKRGAMDRARTALRRFWKSEVTVERKDVWFLRCVTAVFLAIPALVFLIGRG
jgi:hypothetical protein